MGKTIRQVEFPAPLTVPLRRVAAYARVSTGKDAMLHSLSAQVSYYSNLIQQNPEWVYCGVYSDEALTGTKADRKGFCEMLDDCRAGKLDLIITKSLSRMARNTVTLLETIRELRNLGVDVYFEEQNIHTLSADGELILTILSSYAQAESLSASENQKWRVRRGFENGELVSWRFMLGYNISKGKVTINPEEAALVREVFQRFLDGESMRSIAFALNQSGIKSTQGGEWSAGRVRNMLANEKYTGNALLWKKFRNNHIEKKKVPNRGELPMFYAEGTHPAIIDAETFERVQRRLAEVHETAVKRAPKTHSVFSGIIRCECCGRPYLRIKNHQYFAWKCAAKKKQGDRVCPSAQIREDILQAAAAQALGIDEFDEHEFQSRIADITAKSDRTLIFHFRNGTESEIKWQPASRSQSWTPEMKAAAAERGRKKRRGK